MSAEPNEIQARHYMEIDWTDENVPRSLKFRDTYYSRDGGRSESGHVFLAGNGLPKRWSNCSRFRIAELGFGTGLNFLETLHQWRKHAQDCKGLEYISFERFPLESHEIARALSSWPELAEIGAALIDNWHRDQEMLLVDFAPNVRLIVFFSDANLRLPKLEFEADAWYLDGFAPDRNPELWSQDLLKHVHRHTIPGGTFATYSAAGHVRRNLVKAGFSMVRAPGFANKREMLHGSKP